MQILLIEDDLDDIELLQDVMAGTAHDLHIANDGDAAVELIKSGTIAPDIIILDLNLPKIHGREVLLEIKSFDAYRNIPLVILTTSSATEDITYAYENGANKYLIKPHTAEELKGIVKTIFQLAGKE
jgi:DNA-binding response OmpR family regulator